VVFVATKCPYSNAYNERYNGLAADLKKLGKKVAFFPINSNDTESMEEVKKHAEEHKFTFPVLKDEKHAIADGFKAEKTPEAYLVGADGKVFYHGRIDDDTEGKKITRKDLLAALEEHLAGKKVTVAETKAFGCSIKRK
jgi:peroxiredoxin